MSDPVEEKLFDPAHTALLICDYQNMQVGGHVKDLKSFSEVRFGGFLRILTGWVSYSLCLWHIRVLCVSSTQLGRRVC